MRKFLSLLLVATLAIVWTSCDSGLKEQQFVEVFKEVKAKYAPDRRDDIFDVKLEVQDGNYVLLGRTTVAEAKEELINTLTEKGFEPVDSIRLLPDESLEGKVYGVVTQSVINLRYAPNYTGEFATQLLMGTPISILEREKGWVRVLTPEGYISWVTSGSIAPMNEEEIVRWRSSSRVIVTTHYTLLRETPSLRGTVLTDAVWGNIFEEKGVAGAFIKVVMPNGKEGYIERQTVEPFNSWVASRNANAENVIATAKQFLGFPYFWGGTSIKALDCSGMTKTSFYLNGVITRRDASQQAKTGIDIELTEDFGNLVPGDLLFFGRKATETRGERITHVAIYMGDGEFIHAATTTRINSLLPDSPIYYSASNTLVRARRFIGEVDSGKGLVSIAKHPWYFEQ